MCFKKLISERDSRLVMHEGEEQLEIQQSLKVCGLKLYLDTKIIVFTELRRP